MAPVPPRLRPGDAEELPRVDHRGGDRGKLPDAARGAGGGRPWASRAAGSGRPARPGGRARRLARGRRPGAVVPRRRGGSRGGPRTHRRGRLRDPLDANRREAGHGDRGEHRRRRAVRRLPPPAAAADPPARRGPVARRGPPDPAPRARPLGQPRPHGGARVCRLLPLGLAQAARPPRPALHRLRARQRLDRHQRHRAHERERERHEPPPGVPRQGRGARRRLPALRHPRLPDRPIQRADRDRRTEDRRPARPGGRGLVEAQGRRDLRLHPRLRRLPGQGQLRGPARAAGLRPHARGRAPTCWPTRSRRTAAS